MMDGLIDCGGRGSGCTGRVLSAQAAPPRQASSRAHRTAAMATSSTDTSSTSSKLPNSGGGSGGVLMLGLSGLSSSGKTTLGRLLQRIFAGTTLLHQDDFYLADAEIPVDAASGLADWDCAGSLDFARMRAALLHIRAHDGALPADLDSIQAGNSVGPAVVAEAVVERLVAEVGERVERWKSEGRRGGRRKLVIVDGFLLFHQGSVVEDCFDAKVLLRASYEKAKQRREARTGYVTIEGAYAVAAAAAFLLSLKESSSWLVWPGLVWLASWLAVAWRASNMALGAKDSGRTRPATSTRSCGQTTCVSTATYSRTTISPAG